MRRLLSVSNLAVLVLALLTGASPLHAQQLPVQSDAVVTLLPGDVVRVEIWQEKDLSGEFLVDENGMATFPMLGDTRVTGIPMSELRRVLVERYTVHLRNPSISITPLRRINVLGEVNKPGVYLVDPTISLAGAVALASGATASGDLNRIRVIRNGQVLRDRISASAALNSIDVRSGDQILVQQRNWFSRNSTFVVSMLLTATSILITVAR